jgi:hypothetical protein
MLAEVIVRPSSRIDWRPAGLPLLLCTNLDHLCSERLDERVSTVSRNKMLYLAVKMLNGT